MNNVTALGTHLQDSLYLGNLCVQRNMSRWIRPKRIWGKEYLRGWEEDQGKINSRRPVFTFPILHTLPLWEVCEHVRVCLSDILTHRHTFTNSLSFSTCRSHMLTGTRGNRRGGVKQCRTGREEAAVTTVSTAGTNTAAYANTSQPHQHSVSCFCGKHVEWRRCHGICVC